MFLMPVTVIFTMLHTKRFLQKIKREKDGQSYLKATWMICAGGPKGSVGNVLKELYDVYYTNDKYKDVLYEVDGKPLILP